MDGFIACFEGLEDPRTGNAGRHDLLEILMIALCTVLCGGQSAVDMAEFAEDKEAFLRGFLTLEHGPPSHDTFSRVLRRLDPDQFRACFQRFMTRFAETAQGVVAIDGKVLRRSFDTASGKSALHRVTAWGSASSWRKSPPTRNPMKSPPAAGDGVAEGNDRDRRRPQLSARHRPADCRAGRRLRPGPQRKPGNLAQRCQAVPRRSRNQTAHTTVDGDHGRIETRACSVSTDIGWLQEVHDWPGLAAIGKVIRTRETSAKVTTETAYYLLSAPLSAERFGQIARSHWAVENSLHWCLDVILNEDNARNRLDNGPYNPPPHGPQSHPQGAVQGFPARQDQAGRMEGRIPRQSPRSNLKCDCPATRGGDSQLHRA
jgi:DDE_Tnp_1-associated